jgi:hypothetical protein
MPLNCFSVSATNCARLYNEAQSQDENVAHEWQFNLTVTTEEVWDAFVILALLDDHQLRNTRLCVPHGNSQSARYTAAMRARNERIITEGQDELPHACYGCMRLFSMPDGTTHYTEVVVTDGITVGRPCCAVPHCKNSLASTRDRFCSADPSHRQLELICAVDGCDQPVSRFSQSNKLRKSCSNPLHMKMEDARAVLSRSGKSKTQRMKTAKLNDVLVASSEDHPEDPLPVEDVDEWYEHDESTGNVCLKQALTVSSTGVSHVQEACASKDTPKLKAIFFRKRTNNEQLFVRPCGVISGRGTMYHHEAVSNVLVHFRLPHLFYACTDLSMPDIVRENILTSTSTKTPASHIRFKLQCSARGREQENEVLRGDGDVRRRLPPHNKTQGQ